MYNSNDTENLMDENTKIDHLVSHVREYAEERLNLIILNMIDKVSRVLSGAAFLMVLSIVGIFTTLFLSFGLAWWIGEEMQKPFLGFLMVGGFYLVVILLVVVNRKKWIADPVINAFLKNVSDEKD